MQSDSPVSPFPNLFIVGAPKCGTTSLYEYLRQHPQIFFPHDEDDFWRTKEPNHLCPELNLPERFSIKVQKDYLHLYRESAWATWRGDASPYYSVSETAPEAIKALSPDARILMLFRPPVDWMQSYHKDLLRIHLEEIDDFHAAVGAIGSSDLGPSRLLPERVPKYREYFAMSRFSTQVERYYRVFGRDAVKVVLLEDMAAAPEQTFREILAFLGVESSFRPEFLVHNETPRHGRLERCARFAYRWLGVKHVARFFLSRASRRQVLSFIRRKDLGNPVPDPRNDALRELCAPDVDRLSTLIGRDLSHWHLASRR